MGTGLSTVGDHLAALRQTIDALRAYAT